MDMPEVLGSRIVRESCSFHSSSGRKYILTFERPIYEGIPERSKTFPISLEEEQKGDGYVLHAEYHDGWTEIFEGFAELYFRFSAKFVDMSDDICDEETN